MKIHIWADGPCGGFLREEENIEDLFPFSQEGWSTLSIEEKERFVKEYVFDQIHWGFDEITEEQE